MVSNFIIHMFHNYDSNSKGCNSSGRSSSDIKGSNLAELIQSIHFITFNITNHISIEFTLSDLNNFVVLKTRSHKSLTTSKVYKCILNTVYMI